MSKSHLSCQWRNQNFHASFMQIVSPLCPFPFILMSPFLPSIPISQYVFTFCPFMFLSPFCPSILFVSPVGPSIRLRLPFLSFDPHMSPLSVFPSPYVFPLCPPISYVSPFCPSILICLPCFHCMLSCNVLPTYSTTLLFLFTVLLFLEKCYEKKLQEARYHFLTHL